MIFVVSSGKMIFLFPENMILSFRWNMEDDLSKKYTWKNDIFFIDMIILVEKTSGYPPEIEGNPENKTSDIATVQSVIRKYQIHPRILNIKNKNTAKNTFDIPAATSRQINKIIKEKATGPDKIAPKIVRLSGNIINSHLTNIINSDILKDSFSKTQKQHL